jgi:cobalt-zinc-cadmium efflux system outer membrane protein
MNAFRFFPKMLLLLLLVAVQMHGLAGEYITAPEFVKDDFAGRAAEMHSVPEMSLQSDYLALDLNKTIYLALQADPQIKSAVEGIYQAEADLTTAQLPPNPVMNVSNTLMPLNQSFNVNRQGGPPQFDLGMAYPIDWFVFGKRAAEMRAAQLGVEVAKASLNDTIRLRIAGAIAAFYDVLESENLLALAQEDFTELTALKELTEKRVLIGGAGSIELDRVNLSLLSSQTELRAKRVALENAMSRLKAFLGMQKNKSIHVAGSLEIDHPLPISDPERLIQIAEENRPDIAMLKRQIEQSVGNIELEETKAYPSVVTHLGVTRQFQKQAIGFPDQNSWGIGVDVSLPIFDRNQGNIAKAKSVKRQSELDLDTQLIELRSEIERNYHVYDASYLVLVNEADTKLGVSKLIRDKMKAAYALGGKSLFELLDAQRNYRETNRVHIMTLSNYWHSLYALNAAIGKQVLK